MSEEWGPWIDGSVVPPIGSFLQMKVVDLKGRGNMMHEAVFLGLIDGMDMSLSPELPVARVWEMDCYRIRKPRGLTILESIIADLPAPVGPKVDA